MIFRSNRLIKNRRYMKIIIVGFLVQVKGDHVSGQTRVGPKFCANNQLFRVKIGLDKKIDWKVIFACQSPSQWRKETGEGRNWEKKLPMLAQKSGRAALIWSTLVQTKGMNIAGLKMSLVRSLITSLVNRVVQKSPIPINWSKNMPIQNFRYSIQF